MVVIVNNPAQRHLKEILSNKYKEKSISPQISPPQKVKEMFLETISNVLRLHMVRNIIVKNHGSQFVHLNLYRLLLWALYY